MTLGALDRTFSWKSFLFSPKARVTRFDFWVRFFLPVLALALAFGYVGLALKIGAVTLLAFALLVAYPSIAVGIKRLHDVNWSGWWLLLSLLPIVGSIFIAIMQGMWRGTAGANRFGPDAGDRDASAAVEAGYAAAIIGAVVLVFAPDLLGTYSIPAGSMHPTIAIGDHVYVSKFPYGYSNNALPFGLQLISGRVLTALPERGDIVVFKLPRDNKTDFIKRIVGLPGDRIQVKGGILHINDRPVERERLENLVLRDGPVYERRFYQYMETLPNGRKHRIIETSDSEMNTDDTPVYQVPRDHVFAMGDNRDNSQDSRFLTAVGYIPIENLVGRAEVLQRGFALQWVR